MTYWDYETLAIRTSVQDAPAVLEAWTGTSIVQWSGNIEGQLSRMEERYRAAKNVVYAGRVHQFLQTWRDNQISGSINVETLDILEAASAQLAVDDWQLKDYFRNLRDQLRKLRAAQEELPMTMPAPRRRRITPREGPGAPPPGGETGAPGPGVEPEASEPA